MSHRKLVVALAGLPAAGKSSAATLLSERLGFSVLRTRDVIASLIEAEGKEINDENLQAYGSRLVSDEESKVFLQQAADRMALEDKWVIDAVRPMSHYKYFRDLFPNFRLLFVLAPDELRESRYLKRGSARNTIIGSFSTRSELPVDTNATMLLQFADAVVVNKEKEEYDQQILQTVSRWGLGHPSSSFQELIAAVEQFHHKHGYDVRTGNMAMMSLRVGLMIEELGEIHACVSKGLSGLEEEHADLLYLLLGNCVTLDLDLERAFFEKHKINMQRESKQVGELRRVSDWPKET